MSPAAARPLQAQVFDQDPHGWYVEPEDCTAGLAEVEALDGRTWDPACGQGNVVKALRRAGLLAFGTDLVRRVPDDGDHAAWFLGEHDFLNPEGMSATLAYYADNIVMNPPFMGGIAIQAFIRKAVTIARRKVCVFASTKFLFSSRRARGLFAELPPTRTWYITPRPSCPPGHVLQAGGEAEGGRENFVWLVWERGAQPSAPGWLVRPGK